MLYFNISDLIKGIPVRAAPEKVAVLRQKSRKKQQNPRFLKLEVLLFDKTERERCDPLPAVRFGKAAVSAQTAFLFDQLCGILCVQLTDEGCALGGGVNAVGREVGRLLADESGS